MTIKIQDVTIELPETFKGPITVGGTTITFGQVVAAPFPTVKDYTVCFRETTSRALVPVIKGLRALFTPDPGLSGAKQMLDSGRIPCENALQAQTVRTLLNANGFVVTN